MEGTGPCFKFQSGYHCGGSVLRGGVDSASLCNPVYYGATGPAARELDSLPTHLHNLVSQRSQDLDTTQQHRIADVLLRYADLFPAPGSTLTGHTDAVEHEIDTGNSAPICCTPRRMSPQKMKLEEECVTDMLTGGQIEPSDSPWSSPVVLVTKKDGGTRLCVDYRHCEGRLPFTNN